MKPVEFPEVNLRLTGPRGNSRIEPLPVWSDGECVISAWRPSWRERWSLLLGRPVWLFVLSGYTQPPVALTVESPFAGGERKAA